MKAHSEIHFENESTFLEYFEKFHIQNAQQAELILINISKPNTVYGSVTQSFMCVIFMNFLENPSKKYLHGWFELKLGL